jgi:thiol-disulfide isomerase/thioredoxin
MKRVLILLFGVLLSSQGFALRVKFDISNTKNDTLVVGNYFGSYKNMIVLDTIILKNGIGEFKNDTLKSGLFFLYNDKNKYDILLSSSEKSLKVSFKSPDFFPTVKIDGSAIASTFIDYMKFLNEKKELVKKDSTLAKRTGKEVSDYLDKTIAANKNNILGKFLNFYTPVIVPEGTQEYRFKFYKQHFFDNANIFDTELLHTPLAEEKLTEYFSTLVGTPKEICQDVDTLLAKSSDKEVFRFVLVNTFQHYIKSNQVIAENIWVHIAQKWYIPKASWSDFAYMERLKHEVKMRLPNRIGEKAPDFAVTVLSTDDFLTAQTDSIKRKDVYQGKENRLSSIIGNDYTLLIFFEGDCSHCKEVMPHFYEVFNKYASKGLKSVIVHNNNTPEGKVLWCDYINQNKMYNWVNCWSPYSNQYKDLYNIVSTPTVYLLNKGVIELKNIDFKTLDEFLKNKIL